MYDKWLSNVDGKISQTSVWAENLIFHRVVEKQSNNTIYEPTDTYIDFHILIEEFW